MSLSYVEYRPNKKGTTFSTGHTKGRSYMSGVGQRKETKKMNMVDKLSKLK
jgi:hypothetical protein